ncbi:hypothetical protein Desca_0559 [Desulfotomaculum nigrificans CO-1-SRB]|uniref:Uncharacterized protein n=1 Tax=Desulfotomaculum nigrificans (strain DSM 14880 / VKM B-2319 / CO-1-SRB) TaxID=868595 RepID=F6B7S7_DESCC|nr:hypothetical protein [Desulfotomaculum nigrificans]AEF93449.1 hypothetical protein Desca_0559 [Desulfotomaculum nigrificans CO-1-SRB]
MNLTTKCRDCQYCANCDMKKSLNEVAQKVIKRTEQAIRKEAAVEMEYMIVTDVMIIPTNCQKFSPKESTTPSLSKKVANAFAIKNSLATT